MKIAKHLLFFCAFALICQQFGYVEIAKLAPQSQHAWRQTDGASMALNFYQDGFNFFEPRLHNCIRGDGRAVGEFPLTYYIASFCMLIFGDASSIVRLVNLIFWVVGLWFFFRLLYDISCDYVSSVTLSLLLFCSAVVAFYAFTTLPNTPALAFLFATWWHFYQFFKTKSSKNLYLGSILWAFACAIKPTLIITTGGSLGLLWLFDFFREKENRVYFLSPLKNLIPLSITPIFLLVWRLWANHYVAVHHGEDMFLATIAPYWKATPWEKNWILGWVFDFWTTIIFHKTGYFFLSAIFILAFFSFKKINRNLFWILGVTILGNFLIAVLFFIQYSAHDYYILDFWTLPAFLLVVFAFLQKKWDYGVYVRGVINLALLGLIFFNFKQAKKDLDNRYEGIIPYALPANRSILKVKEMRDYTQSIGIKPTDTVYCANDPSTNTLLYYLNVKGYTVWNKMIMRLGDSSTRRTPDSLFLDYLIKEKSCKYLIINEIDEDRTKKMAHFMKPENLVGVFDSSVFFYKIR
jgi:Dolichyl-phosphate-mannose-protein mannosyltransferase